MSNDLVLEIQRICLALPDAVEQETWGERTFRVRAKIFATANTNGSLLSCKAPPGIQEILIGADPSRFFRPAYVGHCGWIGVRIDADTDWTEVADLIGRSYAMTAPRRRRSVNQRH